MRAKGTRFRIGLAIRSHRQSLNAPSPLSAAITLTPFAGVENPPPHLPRRGASESTRRGGQCTHGPIRAIRDAPITSSDLHLQGQVRT